jgi:soluble lytic murein transglycosylase-like protein
MRFDRVNAMVGDAGLTACLHISRNAWVPVPYLACMLAAATAYHLPVRALPAIQAVEGGYVGAVIPNRDGTHDLGVMQVNSRWTKAVAAYTHLPEQVVVVRLITNPCFNIKISAAILRGYLIESHGNMMQAIGYYHSHTTGLSGPYRMKVLEEAMAMSAAEGHHPAPPHGAPRHAKITPRRYAKD